MVLGVLLQGIIIPIFKKLFYNLWRWRYMISIWIFKPLKIISKYDDKIVSVHFIYHLMKEPHVDGWTVLLVSPYVHQSVCNISNQNYNPYTQVWYIKFKLPNVEYANIRCCNGFKWQWLPQTYFSYCVIKCPVSD